MTSTSYVFVVIVEILKSVTFILLLKELYLSNPYIIVWILIYVDQLLNMRQFWEVLMIYFWENSSYT